MSNSRIRLERLTIEAPFGPESSTIDIKFRLEERITVLFGRNGSGKTVTLDLLDAIRNGRYCELRQYPSKSLTLKVSDGSSLILTPVATNDIEVHYSLTRPNLENAQGRLGQRENMVGDMYCTGESSLLRDFRQALPKTKYIRADRLIVRDPAEAQPSNDKASRLMVERLRMRVKSLITEADVAYREVSMKLDGTIMTRLFESEHDTPDLETLTRLNMVLHIIESRLLQIGLLSNPPSPISEILFTEEKRTMAHILLKDREEKLGIFSDLANKADHLLRILNRKFAPKEMKLDIEAGYQVFAASGEPLKLAQLSSGEQHELVLLHELLFDVDPNTIVLIDEPELSLHVTWQEELLQEFMAIAKLSDLDFVLATHSPYIVDDDHLDVLVRVGPKA